MNDLPMRGKTVVITGATSGLGEATARQLSSLGAHVLIVARNKARADALVGDIKSNGRSAVSVIADLSIMSQVRMAADQIATHYSKIDVLINNAGSFYAERADTEEGFERTLATNHLAPYLMIERLLSNIREASKDNGPARIINIASLGHKRPIHWKDLNWTEDYDGPVVYEHSKHLMISATYKLARELKGENIIVSCVHPGFVKSNLIRGQKLRFPMNIMFPLLGGLIGINPQKAAETPVWLASSEAGAKQHGNYIVGKKQKKSWRPTYDTDAQDRLKRITQDLLQPWLLKQKELNR